MKRKVRQRFTLKHLRSLWQSHEQITGAIMALNRATWAGAIPVLVNLQQVDRVLCELYNHAETGFTPDLITRYVRSSEETPAEASAESNQNG